MNSQIILISSRINKLNGPQYTLLGVHHLVHSLFHSNRYSLLRINRSIRSISSPRSLIPSTVHRVIQPRTKMCLHKTHYTPHDYTSTLRVVHLDLPVNHAQEEKKCACTSCSCAVKTMDGVCSLVSPLSIPVSVSCQYSQWSLTLAVQIGSSQLIVSEHWLISSYPPSSFLRILMPRVSCCPELVLVWVCGGAMRCTSMRCKLSGTGSMGVVYQSCSSVHLHAYIVEPICKIVAKNTCHDHPTLTALPPVVGSNLRYPPRAPPEFLSLLDLPCRLSPPSCLGLLFARSPSD